MYLAFEKTGYVSWKYLLPSELFKNFGGSGESISGFSYWDVQTKLFEFKLSHWVFAGFGPKKLISVNSIKEG